MELKFGDKVKFGVKVHDRYRDKEYCLLGICDSAVALVEWSKRGEYNFEYVGCKPEKDLIKLN